MNQRNYSKTFSRKNVKAKVRHGDVSEWPKERASKACVGSPLPWVQIPPSPPKFEEKMGWYKRGWWKIQPKGSGNAASAFGLMDELFRPTVHEAHIQLEEQSRKIVVNQSDGSDFEITIHIPKDKQN